MGLRNGVPATLASRGAPRGDDDKPAEHAESDIAIAALRGEAVTVQVGAVHVEPHLGALDVGIKALHQPPKPRRGVKLHEMEHLVRAKVVEHDRGRENEPPRERQYARVRARAPTARLVAHVDALDGNAELGRVAPARRLEIALRLASEEIAGAAADVRGPPPDHQPPVPRFSLPRAPPAASPPPPSPPAPP